MDEIKPNFAELAKTLGCDYRTAKKYYHRTLTDQTTPLKRKIAPSKLDSYKTIIEDKMKFYEASFSFFFLDIATERKPYQRNDRLCYLTIDLRMY